MVTFDGGVKWFSPSDAGAMVFYVVSMSITEAIIRLRQETKLSQQFLATELRMSTKTFQLYESGARDPAPRQLLWFAARATELEDTKLASELWSIFSKAFVDALGTLPPGITVNVEHCDFGSITRYRGAPKKGTSR